MGLPLPVGAPHQLGLEPKLLAQQQRRHGRGLIGTGAVVQIFVNGVRAPRLYGALGPQRLIGQPQIGPNRPKAVSQLADKGHRVVPLGLGLTEGGSIEETDLEDALAPVRPLIVADLDPGPSQGDLRRFLIILLYNILDLLLRGPQAGAERHTAPELVHALLDLLPQGYGGGRRGNGGNFVRGMAKGERKGTLVIGDNAAVIVGDGVEGVSPQGISLQHLLDGGIQIGLHIAGVLIQADGAGALPFGDKVQDGADQLLIGLSPEDGGVILADPLLHMGGDGGIASIVEQAAAGQQQNRSQRQQGRQDMLFHRRSLLSILRAGLSTPAPG